MSPSVDPVDAPVQVMSCPKSLEASSRIYFPKRPAQCQDRETPPASIRALWRMAAHERGDGVALPLG